MYRFVLGTILALVASAGSAADSAGFAGRWVFDAAKSTNAQAMAQATIVSTITQTSTTLIVLDHSMFNGKSIDDRTVYDLTGVPAQNRSMMGGPATTTSHWDGGRLVTVWESGGAMAGTTVRRTETRHVSADGRTMFVESSRAERPTLVLAFDRAR